MRAFSLLGQDTKTACLRNRTLQALLMGGLVFLLVACEATSAPPSKKSPSTPTTLPPGLLLFQADWSHGLADWQASAGWKVLEGNLQSDESNELSITIPYKLTTPNYAVEFRVQIVSVPKDGGYFELIADRVPGKDGYRAYVNSLLTAGTHPYAIHPAESVVIDPLDSMDASQQISDYEPGSQWHIYRVEVRGSYVGFFIDDHRASAALSAKTAVLSNGPLRLKCGEVVLRVSSLRIKMGSPQAKDL